MTFYRSKFALVALIAGVTSFNAADGEAASLFDNLKSAVKEAASDVVNPTSQTEAGNSVLSLDDITAGLKEALRVGSESVTRQVGGLDGYNKDSAIHIPLPENLQTVQTTLRKFGLSSFADDVELKINRAAEAAAPKTKQIFWDAVTAMTLDDARAIYDGPDDAATQYFKRVSTLDLKNIIKPIVDQSLNEVGAVQAYDTMMGEYQNLPFVPNVKSDLSNHTVDLALKGIFHYLAIEEAGIRQDPAKRTTEILTKVFGL